MINLIFRKKVFLSILLVLIISISIHFFPLIDALGYEFSALFSLIISFVSLFTASEIVSDYNTDLTFARSRIEDVVYSVVFLNLLILAIPFTSGLIGSSYNEYCYFREGLLLFLLLPLVSAFFSTALGAFCGYVFGKRGFITGSLILAGIIVYSLFELYYKPHLFFYNPVLGYFPGPIYDRVIPIDTTLFLYRGLTVAAGLFFLRLIQIMAGSKNYKFGFHNIFILFLLLAVLLFGYLNRQELGFTYTREYIKNNFLTETLETENFFIHYSPYFSDKEKIELIAKDHEWRFYELSRFLNTSSEVKVHSYIYPDEKMRKKLIGAGNTTIANPIHGEIHLVYDSFPLDVLKHELVHVMSAGFGSRVLKISPKFGLVEGIAVAADWNADSLSPHKLSKTLVESGKAPEIKDILDHGFWYSPGATSYTLMGSFCRFLVDKYGIEKFKDFYRSGKTSVYGKSVEELSTLWKAYLKNIEITEKERELSNYRLSDKGLFGSYCPRVVEGFKEKGIKAYRDNNFLLAAKYFQNAVDSGADNSDIKTMLGYSSFYNRNYSELENSDIYQDVEGTNGYILENLKANAMWINDDYEQANEKFKELRQKPLPRDILREIDIKISLENFDGNLRKAMAGFFSTRNDVEKVSILSEIVRSYPEFSPAYYLLGRIHYSGADYDRAAKYLYYANSGGLPTERLQTENLRLLGMSHYGGERYGLALETFEHFLIRYPESGISDSVSDMVRRTKWTVSNYYRNSSYE